MASFMLTVIMGVLLLLILVFSFFVFDQVILLGYFKKKLQKRFKIDEEILNNE